MNISLQGYTAVVCGSTQGIGKATALELARMGAEIILLARNEKKLQETLNALDKGFGAQHSYEVADFSDTNEVETIALEIAKKHTVHILVNNTGGPPGGSIHEAENEAFTRAFNQHLINNHSLLRAFIPKMKAAGYGRVINIISTSVKQPLPGLGVSNTIRAAVANWAKTMANELGEYGITVNNVLPGATLTGRLEEIAAQKAKSIGISPKKVLNAMALDTPLKRIGKAEEVANAIAFLASPAAGYIHGINLPVDGGRTRSL
jgi:3-oxoacyl-[acyl-carrier protein] reductase